MWRVVKAVFEHSAAEPTDRLLLLHTAERCNADGVAWFSNADAMRRTKLALRTIQRSKTRLEQLGELSIERGAGPHGVDLYLKVREGAESPPASESHPLGGTEASGGDFEGSSGRHGDTQTNEPPKEPISEPKEISLKKDLIQKLGETHPDLVDLPQKLIDEDNCATRFGKPLRLTEVIPVVLDLAAKHEGDFGATERATRWHFYMDGRPA